MHPSQAGKAFEDWDIAEAGLMLAAFLAQGNSSCIQNSICTARFSLGGP